MSAKNAKKKKQRRTPKVIIRLKRITRLNRKIRARIVEIGLLGISRRRSVTKVSKKVVAVLRDLKRVMLLQSELIIELIGDGEVAMQLTKLNMDRAALLSHSLDRVLEMLAGHLPEWRSEDERELEGLLFFLEEQEEAFLEGGAIRVPTANQAKEILARALIRR